MGLLPHQGLRRDLFPRIQTRPKTTRPLSPPCEAMVPTRTPSPRSPLTLTFLMALLPAFASRAQAQASPAGHAWTTFLGGSQDDRVQDVIGPGGDIFVCGTTFSSNLAVTSGALQTKFQGRTVGNGKGDAFVARLSADGKRLVYLTYLGGSSGDEGTSIDVDSKGIATGELIATLDPPADSAKGIVDLAMSKDGKQLFSASSDTSIRAWDLIRMRPSSTWLGNDQGVIDLLLKKGDGSVCYTSQVRENVNTDHDLKARK